MYSWIITVTYLQFNLCEALVDVSLCLAEQDRHARVLALQSFQPGQKIL